MEIIKSGDEEQTLFGTEKIQYKVPEKTSKKLNSERAEIISRFVEQINKDRIGTKWEPITPKAVALKVGHLKNNMELHSFYKICETSKSGFGKCFFGALKVR